MLQSNQPTLFISYKNKVSRDLAQLIYTQLTLNHKEAYQVLIDRVLLNGGDDWADIIYNKTLPACCVFLIIGKEHSFDLLRMIKKDPTIEISKTFDPFLFEIKTVFEYNNSLSESAKNKHLNITTNRKIRVIYLSIDNYKVWEHYNHPICKMLSDNTCHSFVLEARDNDQLDFEFEYLRKCCRKWINEYIISLPQGELRLKKDLQVQRKELSNRESTFRMLSRKSNLQY